MSVTTLDSLSVADLSPDRFPVVGQDQILTDGPLSRSYSQNPLIMGDMGGSTQNSLVAGDRGAFQQGKLVLGDEDGLYNDAQILHISLAGVNSSNSEAGILHWNIVAGDGVTFRVLKGAVLVASGVIDTGSFPSTTSLEPVGGSGITGSVLLASANPVADPSSCLILVPLSNSDALIIGGEASGNVGAVVLNGVSFANSLEGTLQWTYELQDEDGERLIFKLMNGGVDVAQASHHFYGEPYFPLVLDIAGLNDSGISGTVTLTNLVGLESYPEFGLLIVMAHRGRQIRHIGLTGVIGANSQNGVLGWSIAAGDPVKFSLFNGESLVASGVFEEAPELFPATLELEEENYSGVGGAVVFNSFDAFDSDGDQKIYTPLSTHDAMVVTSLEDAVSSMSLSGVTLNNSDGGLLDWGYTYRTEGSGHLDFTLLNGSQPVAFATLSLEGGGPGFPIELPLGEVNRSGIMGAVTLSGIAGIDAENSGHGRALVQAARGQAQISQLELTGVSSENSSDGVLQWALLVEENLEFRIYDGETLVASGTSSGDLEFPLELSLEETGSSGVNGKVTLLSGHDSEDALSQRLIVPLSSTIPKILGDETENISSLVLHGVSSKNSNRGVLSWSYERRDTGSQYLRFIIHNGSLRVASAEYALTSGEPTYPLEMGIVASNGSGISGTLVLSGSEGLNEGVQGGLLIIKVLSGIASDASVEVTGRVVSAGESLVKNDATVTDATIKWNLTARKLAGEDIAPLSSDETGKWVAAATGVEQVFVQHSEAIFASVEDYALPSYNIPLFHEAGGSERGSRFIPESWWQNGKRISFNATLAWFKGSSAYADLELSVGLIPHEENEMQTLLSHSLTEEDGALGDAVVEIELVIATTEEPYPCLELRGFSRFNNEVRVIDIAGLPLMGYTFSASAQFMEAEPDSNYVVMRTASLVAYEAPSENGLG